MGLSLMVPYVSVPNTQMQVDSHLDMSDFRKDSGTVGDGVNEHKHL